MKASLLKTLVNAKKAVLRQQKVDVLFAGHRLAVSNIVFDPDGEDPTEFWVDDGSIMVMEVNTPVAFVISPYLR